MKRHPLTTIILFLVWLFSIFVMHLAWVADVFDSRPWYLYLIVVLAFGIQLVVVYLLFKLMQIKMPCVICGVIYVIALLLIIYYVFVEGYIILTEPPAPKATPLDACCICLDFLGVVNCIMIGRTGKSNTQQS